MKYLRMKYAVYLIQEFFTPLKEEDKNNNVYIENCAPFHLPDTIFEVIKLNDNSVQVFFEETSKFCNYSLPGGGHATLAKPHTIRKRIGSFYCYGVSKFKKSEPSPKNTGNDIKITRVLFLIN